MDLPANTGPANTGPANTGATSRVRDHRSHGGAHRRLTMATAVRRLHPTLECLLYRQSHTATPSVVGTAPLLDLLYRTGTAVQPCPSLTARSAAVVAVAVVAVVISVECCTQTSMHSVYIH